MLETDLKLGNDLTKDRVMVKEQMTAMKSKIEDCQRKGFCTEDAKEDFDDFKQGLMKQCDEFVDSQRAKIDSKFAKI